MMICYDVTTGKVEIWTYHYYTTDILTDVSTADVDIKVEILSELIFCFKQIAIFDFYNPPPDCSEGCTSEMLINDECDPECDNEACNWDYDNCLCSDDCFPEMLSDGVCDPECNNTACDFDTADGSDEGDCYPNEEECSKGCNWIDLGDCVC